MDTKPSTHYHSSPVKRFNRIARTLNFFGVAKVDLSEEALLAAARQETGLERFGDERFLPALRVLLKSIEVEAQLNPYGRMVARKRIVASLKNRLWANACFEANPEILKRKIVAPIIIVGPHRSGTTRMQRMLSSDVRLQHLKSWEGLNPSPRFGQPDMGKSARYGEVKQSFIAMDQFYPGVMTAHPMDADWAEEENLLLNHSFCGFSPLGLYNVPGFYNWFVAHDKTYAYQYMADLMRLISWSRGDDEEKRWVLKNPQHMLDLDVLMNVFPDAKIIFTHRDPLKTVGSVMSLMWFFAVQHTDVPCREKIRDTWMDFCERMARRCIQTRECVPAAQQLDVHYEEMNRDWRTVMKRVYAFSEVDFTPQAQQALEAWLENSEKENRHGNHRYSLEDFGTSRNEVDARMMFLREHYAIPYEGK